MSAEDAARSQHSPSRSRRVRHGDPRIRAFLFMAIGATLLFLTFYSGPDKATARKIVTENIRFNMAAMHSSTHYRTVKLEESEQAAEASLAIAATTAETVADSSTSGGQRCAVGFTIANNSSLDILNLEFATTLTAAGRRGNIVSFASLPAFSNRGVTSVAGVAGRCEGVSGQVRVLHCLQRDGRDCSGLVNVVSEGAVPLTWLR